MDTIAFSVVIYVGLISYVRTPHELFLQVLYE